MLKAHSKFLEHLTLAGDLALIAGSWLLAYYLRFYADLVPLHHQIPPLGPYLALLVPILVVWTVTFRAFDLYRPRRLGSRLAEMSDVAKAGTAGVLILLSLTFFMRSYEFSRVVIAYFWLISILAVTGSRALFREALRQNARLPSMSA